MGTAFDCIGDIHGYAGPLKALLRKLGYEQEGGVYSHPGGRKALFVGDYIDRGPDIPEALSIVRSMTESGHAIALMGNHEYNAVLFNTPKPGGGYLRPHNLKNFKQHAETLLQFQGQQALYEDYISWFRSLPLWWEEGNLRAVHASWDPAALKLLKAHLPERRLEGPQWESLSDESSQLSQALETALKGKEARLPDGLSFRDKDGHLRHEVRVKWWLETDGQPFEDISMQGGIDFPEGAVCGKLPGGHYGEKECPVFFGHYWLKGLPNLYRGNICCLDYSVAKGGYLAAYRFDGEQALQSEKWVYV